MKKLSLWLVVLSMMTALLPQTFASAAEAAWFDIEAEEGAERDSHILKDEATGRKYIVANDGFQGHKSTVDFEREAAGTYDVYAVIGVDSSNYIGGYTFTLDEDEFYSKSTEKANSDAVSDTLYTSIALASGSHNKPMKWVKIAEDLEVAAGEHTLISQVTQSTTQPNRMGAIDVVRFVPSNWNWVPDSNFDDPKFEKTYYSVPAGDGLIVEAENGELSGAMASVSESKASGGAYAVVASGTNSGSTAMGIKTSDTDTYDIWAAVATASSGDFHIGGYVAELDETKVYDKGIEEVSATNPDLYGKKIKIAGSDTTIRWVKIAAAQELSAGKHDLVISTKAATVPLNAAGLIDCVAIVPTEWEWDGNSSKLELPAKPSAGGDEEDNTNYLKSDTGIFWIESTDMDYDDTLWKTLSNSNASGGSLLDYGSDKVSEPEPFAVSFGIELPETAHYDAYALINNVALHSSGWKCEVDGESLTTSTHGSSVFNSSSSGFSGYTNTMTWIKIAELKEIEAGQHKIVMQPKISSSFSSRILAALDCVVFVPSEMKWKPKAAADDSEVPGESYARLCAEYVANAYFNGDYSALTDKIELPEDIPTFAGVTISYGCDDEGYIDGNGKVTRPYFNGEDLETNFNIIGTANGKSGKAQIPVKILKNTKYSVKNLNVPSELKAGAKFEVSADVVINAAQDSGIGGNASVIVALYGANGALEDIAVYSDAVTTAGTHLSADITLPSDVSGKTAKVYVINGFVMGNLLTNSVTVK